MHCIDSNIYTDKGNDNDSYVTMGDNIRSCINRDTNTVPNDNKLGVYVN